MVRNAVPGGTQPGKEWGNISYYEFALKKVKANAPGILAMFLLGAVFTYFAIHPVAAMVVCLAIALFFHGLGAVSAYGALRDAQHALKKDRDEAAERLVRGVMES